MDLIPTAEVAALLGVSVRTVNRWADTERLVPVVVAPGPKGARLFDPRDVALLKAHLSTGAA